MIGHQIWDQSEIVEGKRGLFRTSHNILFFDFVQGRLMK